MRTPKNVLSKTEHGKGAADHRQGAVRVPRDALLRQTGPRWMSAATGRGPCGLMKGTLRLQILNIYRASPGLRWICDHEAVEMKFGRVPHGLEILRQAAGFENRTWPGGFVKAPLGSDTSSDHVLNTIGWLAVSTTQV